MATLTQLEYVVAVDQCRHFGRAAALCHVSQPTLSTQLQKLEQELGVVLFDRNKQPVLPTEEGRPFIEQAKVTLTEFRRFAQLAHRDSAELSGTLKLAVIPSVSPYLMPRVLEAFGRTCRNIQLYLEELPTRQIVEALDKELIDAAILATPLGLTRVQEVPLYYEPFFLYAAPGHAFGKMPRVPEHLLSTEELWLPSEEHCLRDQAIAACGGGATAKGGCLPSVHLRGGSLETVIELVSQGRSRGYTILPQLAAEAVARRKFEGSLLELARPSPAREISLAFRRGHLKQSLLKQLQATVEQTLPRTLPREKSKAFRVLSLAGHL